MAFYGLGVARAGLFAQYFDRGLSKSYWFRLVRVRGTVPANFQLLFDNLLLAPPFSPLYNVAITQRLEVNVGDRLFYPSWWFARRAIL